MKSPYKQQNRRDTNDQEAKNLPSEAACCCRAGNKTHQLQTEACHLKHEHAKDIRFAIQPSFRFVKHICKAMFFLLGFTKLRIDIHDIRGRQTIRPRLHRRFFLWQSASAVAAIRRRCINRLITIWAKHSKASFLFLSTISLPESSSYFPSSFNLTMTICLTFSSTIFWSIVPAL